MHPAIFVETALSVLVVATLAAYVYVPARTAGRIDPIVVLRDE